MNQGENPAYPDLHQVGNEIDLAPLVWGHHFQNSGDPVTDLAGNSFVAAVSRVDEMLLGQYASSEIQLKFFAMRQHPVTAETEPVMYNMQGGEFWGPDPEVNYSFNWIPGLIVSHPAEEWAQTPRVIARALEWMDQDNLVIGVDVAYETWTSPVAISVFSGRFLMHFEPEAPNPVLIEPYADPSWAIIMSQEGDDYLFPDLEYGPTSGWTHIVYTAYNPDHPSGRDARIHYRARSGPVGQFSGYVWINEDDGGDNGWIPRIDVGTITDPYHFETQGDVMTVAVVYTRQEVNPLQLFYGYRSYVRYWREDPGPVPPLPNTDSWQLPVVNGEYEPPQAGGYHGSGLPVIDIAPESNPDHDAFVAFVQQISMLPDPIRYSVYMVGHAFQGQQLEVSFVEVSSQIGGTSVLPALCVHYGTRQMSITYYHQCAPGLGSWTVIANRVDYLPEPVVFDDTEIDAEAHGSFNITDLANYNFGVASGLAATVTMNQPTYFAAWSDAVGIVCEPCHIQATFGYSFGG